MKPIRSVRINYPLLAGLLFATLSWLGLYALWANFAAQGAELIREAGVWSSAAGVALIALHAYGLLLLLGLAVGVVAVAIRSRHHGAPEQHRYQG